MSVWRGGGVDVDYRTLYEAFFQHQTKPDKLTTFGDLYYEGKEYETIKSSNFRPGYMSEKLREALGMQNEYSPPPCTWLFDAGLIDELLVNGAMLGGSGSGGDSNFSSVKEHNNTRAVSVGSTQQYTFLMLTAMLALFLSRGLGTQQLHELYATTMVYPCVSCCCLLLAIVIN